MGVCGGVAARWVEDVCGIGGAGERGVASAASPFPGFPFPEGAGGAAAALPGVLDRPPPPPSPPPPASPEVGGREEGGGAPIAMMRSSVGTEESWGGRPEILSARRTRYLCT